MSTQITLAPDDAPALMQIRMQLMAFNQAAARPYDFRALNLLAHDAQGQLIGGLLAATGWDWLQVDVLFVEEPFRKLGHARALLLAAEQIARERACLGAFLDTFDFQARGFYERMGYQVFGTLQRFPNTAQPDGSGHQRFWMSKQL